MSIGHQRRTAPRAATGKKPDATGPDAEVEGLEEGLEVDAEKAARLQGALGNASVAGLVGGGRETGRGGAGAELEAREEGPATEVESPLLLGGTRPTREAPWSAARYFGGGGGGGGRPVDPADPDRWRPRPLPRDLDAPPGGAEAPPDDDRPPVDIGPARAALGEAQVPPTWLNGGLRHPERLAHPVLGAEWLAAWPSPWARARDALRFLARHADRGRVRGLAAVALAAAEAIHPEVAGLAGVVAQALAGLERVLAASNRRRDWLRVVAVAADTAARPRAEFALGDLPGALSAPALYRRAAGSTAAPLPRWRPRVGHPAARRAVALAGGDVALVPLGHRVAPPEDALDAVDRVLRAFTRPAGGDLTPLIDGLNALLSAVGEVEVEAAAVGLAVEPFVPEARILAALVPLDQACRETARRLVPLGRAIEVCRDAWEAERWLGGVEALRAGLVAQRDRCLGDLAAGLLGPGRREPDDPRLLDLAERLRVGRWEGADWSAVDRQLAASLRAGRALGRGEPLPSLPLGGSLGPFTLADRAITRSRAAGSRWRAPLRAAARALRRRGEGGALNLLIAAWAEREARGT